MCSLIFIYCLSISFDLYLFDFLMTFQMNLDKIFNMYFKPYFFHSMLPLTFDYAVFYIEVISIIDSQI